MLHIILGSPFWSYTDFENLVKTALPRLTALL